MLTIRQSQVSALEHSTVEQFQEQLISEIESFAPELCGISGPKAVREVLESGITRAESYGFQSRGSLRFFVHLIFSFGVDFDTDPQLPWAANLLQDRSIANDLERAEKLHNSMIAYAERVVGTNNEHAIAALSSAAKVDFGKVGISSQEYESRAFAEMCKIYPQKVAYLARACRVADYCAWRRVRTEFWCYF